MVGLILVLLVVILTIIFVAHNFRKIKKLPEGTSEMTKMAAIIRSGAKTFMQTEYKRIVPTVLIVAVIFSLFIEKLSGITFVVGATMSSIACVLGMTSATYANVRTANRARETRSIGETVKVALCGGSISGLSVQAFGLLGMLAIVAWHMLQGNFDTAENGSGLILTLGGVSPLIIRVSTYSLGCSIVAMFNRVAGGNYTKAADISSDILAKNRHDLPEDDSRVPNVMADFVGDNVNDIASNCSDLLESFVATKAGAIMVALFLFQANSWASIELLTATILAPVFIAGGGLLSCVIGIFYVTRRKMSEDPAKELDKATYISAALTIAFTALVCLIMFGGKEVYAEFVGGWFGPFLCATLGIASGVGIGKITEHYTSTDAIKSKFLRRVLRIRKRPTVELAEMAPEGEAFVITKGDAIGSRSVLIPVLMIGISLFLAGKLAGFYGVAIAALGMLSFVGTTVSIDAFGPIADNAGGLAESCHLEPEVRVITDKLDAVGNTTAAIGKGFAIGSAAFATVSLIISYIGHNSVDGIPVLNIASFTTVAGAIIGGALIEYFSAILTDNTINSAKDMADVGDAMMTPAVIAGNETPDYDKMIEMAAKAALGKMLMPSLLAMFVPVIGGIVFGIDFVGGILIGATIVAIPRAIFMGNSGGAFDNAKKYIESGQLVGYGKKTPAHKAAVTGDTVGDTRKDVVGVALDIFIKMMSTVANTLRPVFQNITLIR